ALVDKVRELHPPTTAAWRPETPPPDDVVSALGRWWSEGAEFVFRWHDGRLEARLAGAPNWMPWARFERVEGDRFRTVFGREQCPEHEPEGDAERAADERSDHALVADHAPHLPPRHPDGSQHAELARPLEHREHERVHDAEEADDDGEREQHVEHVEDRVQR